MNNLLDSFASAMRSARIKRGLTQRALAERLNMSVRTIIEIERCRSSPKFETVMLLARELNVSLDAIVFQNIPTSNVSKSVIDFFAGKSESEIQKYIALMTVFPRSSSSRAFCIRYSFSASANAVASSNSTTGAFFKIARARAIRCISPPER